MKVLKPMALPLDSSWKRLPYAGYEHISLFELLDGMIDRESREIAIKVSNVWALVL